MAAEGGDSESIVQQAQLLSEESNRAVMACLQTANSLPKQAENYEFYSSYPAFANFIDAERARVLNLASRVLKSAGARKQLPVSADSDGLVDGLIDANDAVFERVETWLDEAEGVRKDYSHVAVVPEVTVAPSWIRKDAPVTGAESSEPAALAKAPPLSSKAARSLTAVRGVQKPQVEFAFADCVDNSDGPFVPKLRVKHHALDRHIERFRLVDDDVAGDEAAAAWTSDEASFVSKRRFAAKRVRCRAAHPYQYELDHFEPTVEQLKCAEPRKPVPLEKTPLTLVETTAQLDELVGTLNGATEFAVDLEHHDYRSFLGITSLIQISTRAADYIVDPFKLWKQLHMLNEPFANPRIVKVMHGARSDVEWLQRDFGVFLVNLFDTDLAMRLLHYAKFSLSHLVQTHCGVALDKRLQCSDWRVRPLPSALIDYARSDTHFLLYCYDRLKHELVRRSTDGADLLRDALRYSRDVCLRLYEKPQLVTRRLEKMWKHKSFNNQQTTVMEELLTWRLAVARADDESVHYVLPNHMLLQIADVLPKEEQGILACCRPVPRCVKRDLHELHRLVVRARDLPLDKQPADAAERWARAGRREPVAWLRRAHDFSHTKQDEEIQPLCHRLSNYPPLTEAACSIAAFDHEERAKKARAVQLEIGAALVDAWVSPYEQYLMAVARRVEQQAAAPVDNAPKEDSDGAAKRFFTHLDPSSRRTLEAPVVDDSPVGASEATPLIADQVPKKRKKQKFRPDLAVGHVEAMVAATKKRRKGDADVAPFKPFDYASCDKSIFEKGRAKPAEDVYDPFRAGGSQKKGQIKKRFTKFTNFTKSLSFAPASGKGKK